MNDAVVTASPPSLPSPPPETAAAEVADLFRLLDRLQPIKFQGRDKRGRRILRIVGKFFPARVVKEEVLRKYLEERIVPQLTEERNAKAPFCVVYMHSQVDRSENFPGVSVLRSIYESLPEDIRGRLEAVYFVHPGLQSRLFLATIGRFLFSSGLYGKVKYVGRLEFLTGYVKKGELEIPEFVYDHDEELEYRPLMDYGIEADHHRAYDAAAMDSASSMYSLRCGS